MCSSDLVAPGARPAGHAKVEIDQLLDHSAAKSEQILTRLRNFHPTCHHVTILPAADTSSPVWLRSSYIAGASAYSLAIASSFSTVFQLRAVAVRPSRRSQKAWVSLACRSPSGHHA